VATTTGENPTETVALAIENQVARLHDFALTRQELLKSMKWRRRVLWNDHQRVIAERRSWSDEVLARAFYCRAKPFNYAEYTPHPNNPKLRGRCCAILLLTRDIQSKEDGRL
jgi:hypothetical protein